MAPGRHTFPGVDPELFRWAAEQQVLAEEQQQPHEEEEDGQDMDEDEDMDSEEEDDDDEVPFSIVPWLLTIFRTPSLRVIVNVVNSVAIPARVKRGYKTIKTTSTRRRRLLRLRPTPSPPRPRFEIDPPLPTNSQIQTL